MPRVKTRKIVPTERQKRAVKELAENGSNKGAALLKAGYSKAMAVKPEKVIGSKGFKLAAKDLLTRLDKQIVMSLDRLEETLPEATTGEASSHLDRCVKTSQLLKGKATERKETSLSSLSTEELEGMLS